MLEDEIKEALEFLDPKDCTYEEWLAVGCALKNEGFDCYTWDQWSAADAARYHPGVCEYKWNTLDRDGYRKGTIFKLCRDKSGHVVKGSRDKNREYDLTSVKIPDPVIRITEPGKDWKPEEDLKKYLRLLFNPHEHVGLCIKTAWSEDRQKWEPRNRNAKRTAQELIEELESGKTIEQVLGSYNPEAGAWITINPCDGVNAKKENIIDYRFALVESDSMPVSDQIETYKSMNLPIAAIVYSGSRSAHAIVRINARDEKEFNQRINKLFDECRKAGLDVDDNNKDISRLSRIPGVTRGKHKQFLMCGEVGLKSYEEWENSLYEWQMPEENPYTEILNPPPGRETIIEGYLKERGKMIISGSPKTGKSFLIYQLAYAVANGKAWIGHKCKKGTVHYFDGELYSEDTYKRLMFVRNSLHMDHPKSFHITNKKSSGVSLQKIANDAKHGRYRNTDLIVIDPLYMFLEADENSNHDMKKELELIDEIITYTGAAVIVVHHMSKGLQSGKSSMDRLSGAGTIGRFFETILTLNLLSIETGDQGRAERLEGDARSFEKPIAVNLWFQEGIHRVDGSGELSFRQFYDPKKTTIEEKNANDVAKVNHVYAWMKENGKLNASGQFTLEDFQKAYKERYKAIAGTTTRDHLKKAGYIISKGTTMKKTKAGKPKKYEVNLYSPDGLEIPDLDEDEGSNAEE